MYIYTIRMLCMYICSKFSDCHKCVTKRKLPKQLHAAELPHTMFAFWVIALNNNFEKRNKIF